ncbi:MAG: DUF342 domain-containing protein [Bacillota bacterium]
MNNQAIYQDEYVNIFPVSNDVYIESHKPGLSLNLLYNVISSHPEIQITNFNCLKDAVNSAPKPAQKFGELKERIILFVTEDGLKATITFNLPKEQLELKNRESLVKETYSVLNKKGIVFGTKKDLFFGDIESGKSYVIAEGTSPVNGKDCEIKMYELEEPKPQIKEDGKVNFYELKLISKVKAGDWLGERIDATEGIPGKTVYGASIPAVKGKNFPLMYDKNTVYEIYQNGKTSLYSKINGAVNYSDGKILVSNHLEIDGNVDFKTGNIKFDGYVTIKGTVTDGFSVEATKDIEINSAMGLGNVKGIVSKEGSIFIKGGIASKGQVEVRAKKNVYTKFVDNATIKCEGIVHIGFYCINSNVEAKEIFIESVKGNIIGGNIKAEIKITSAVIGSQLEIRTVIEVTGFDRNKLSDLLGDVNKRIEDLKSEQLNLKQALSKTDSGDGMTSAQTREYNQKFQRLVTVKEEIKSYEDEKKSLARYLKTKGEGEVAAAKKIFPNCLIIIKGIQTEVKTAYMAATFFVQDGELKQI